MKTLIQLLADILEIKPEDITDETSPSNVDTWDSFNGLLMVSELETNFNVTFTLAEVRSVKCVKDIKESLRLHGVQIV